MTVLRHIDFEPPNWGELDQAPTDYPTYEQRILALSPKAYWRLGDLVGQPALDTTGNLDAGTYSNSVLHQQSGAVAHDNDGSIYLNGTDSAVDFPNTDLLNNATEATLVFWMNYHAPAVTVDSGVIARWSNNQGGLDGWMIWVDANAAISGDQRTLTFAASVSDGSNGRIEGDTDLITPGQWDFFALTFSGGQEFCIYKNGQLSKQKTTTLSSFASTNHSLRLGTTGGSIGHLPASLDEVAIYETVLTANQIESLYESGIGRLNLPEMGGLS